MIRLRVLSIVSLLCALTLLTSPLLAQETTGGVQGTVKDPTDAVIPDAIVEVSSPALIGKKTATSDQGGFFRVEGLPPGLYKVDISRQGFAPRTFANLE